MILYVFLITLFLLTLLIIKIILYSNSQRLSINKIVSIYYWENTRLVHKAKKGWNTGDGLSEYLYNLNEDTIEKILRTDIEYRRNLYVYQVIANLSLINYKNKVQENYTEPIDSPDIISMWASAVEELIENELYTDAINQYNTMIKFFISHEVYISSSKVNRLLEQIFVGISASESKVIFEQNKKSLFYSIGLTVKYGYYKLNNDFSYTRLGKMKNMLYLEPLYSDFMIDYYNLIDKNKHFNDLEKSQKLFEYFDSLRMMAIGVNNYLPRGIKFFEVSREIRKYNEDVSLVGIPLSKLLLLLLGEDKKGRLLYFLNDYNDDSIYFSSLVVASKLAMLYFQAEENDESHKKFIEDYLILILAKLIELDEKKLKYYCYAIKQNMNFDRDSLYWRIFLTKEEMEFINIIKQTLMIKKKEIDIKNTSFSNLKLNEIVNVFSTRYNSNILRNEQKQEDKKLNDKFGLLVYLS